MHTYHYQMEGLNCQACQKIIQKQLGKIAGIDTVAVELNGQLEVKSTRELDKAELINALKNTDYKIL